MREKLVTNATFLSLNWVAITILPVFFWFVIGKTLPPESYGIVATALQTCVVLSYIASLGLPMAVVKLIPEFLVKGDMNKVQGTINYSLKLTILAICILSSVLIIFNSQLSSLMKLESSIIFSIILMFALNTLGNLFKNIYYGFENMKKVFTSNLIGQSLRVLITFVLILLGFTYFGPILGILVCFAIILVLRIDTSLFRISENPEIDSESISKYSTPSFVRLIFTTIFGNTQFIILTILKTITISGLYATATTVSSLISTIPQVVDTALFPTMSGLCSDKHGKKKQRYMLRLVTRYSLILVVPIAMLILVFSDYIVLLLTRESYIEASKFLFFLVPAEIFNSFGGLFLSAIYAIGEPKKIRDAWIIATVIYVLLAFPLTFYFSAMGLALAYCIAASTFLIYGLYYVIKYLDFRLPIRDILIVIIPTLLLGLFLILSRHYIIQQFIAYGILTEFLAVGILIGVSGLIYSLTFVLSGSLIEEDLKIIETLSIKSPVFSKQIERIGGYLSKYVKRSYVE